MLRFHQTKIAKEKFDCVKRKINILDVNVNNIVVSN